VAPEEAIAHLEEASRINRLLPADNATDHVQLGIQMLLVTAHQSSRGWDAPEVMDALAQARELSQRRGETRHRVPLLWYIALYRCLYCDFAGALAAAAELDDLASTPDGCKAVTVARWSESMTRCWMGEFERAADTAERMYATYDHDLDHGLVWTCNHEPRCGTAIWHAFGLWARGLPDRAAALAHEHVALARKVGHPFNLAYNLAAGSLPFALRGESAIAAAWCDEADEIARRYGMALMADAIVPGWRAFALAADGRTEEALEATLLTVGVRADLGFRLLGVLPTTLRAECLRQLGRLGDAATCIERALAQALETGHAMVEAESWRVKAAIHRTSGDTSTAVRVCERAIHVAQRQRALGFELRATMELVRCVPTPGEADAARLRLGKLVDGFTAGCYTRDVVAARELVRSFE